MLSHNRLLIIDDDPDLRALLRIYAEALGYQVADAGEGDASLFEYDRLLPSVILLDLSMPERDGVQILRELAGRGCEAPIVLTSGQNDRVLAATQRLGGELGLKMPFCLSKPVNQRDMRAALSRTWNHTFVPTADELEHAIKAGEMVVHYQPKIGLGEGRGDIVTGSEALVRWQHPQKGLQPPGNFVPVAEESGLIAALTDTVLARVIDQLGVWSAKGLRLPVAINLSPSQLTDLELPDRLTETLLRAGIDPAQLVIEVTEQTISPDSTKAIDILTRLRLKRFGVSLDDFGAGYSSIAEVYRLPLSEVKIDRSITIAAETDPDARKVLRAIVDLAHSFDLKVCAEGVETEKGVDFLRKAGCDSAQGFYFSKPLPPSHFQHFVGKMMGAADGVTELDEARRA